MVGLNSLKLRLAILICLLISQSYCGLRFADEEMMKEHHKHQLPNNPNADPITVHLVPHSHDDVGWLKTVDDYYYGGRQDIQWAGVQYTIDTVVQQLVANADYRFTIVEVAFLYRWWNQASKQQQQDMKKLVQNGQLVFINGGWCMSDQATPYYQDFIDQMTIGLKWLKQTFNYVPEVAWHIDPFGHQAAAASMFSKMGFQAFFFSRIDYQDKQLRLAKKALEMIWKPTQYTPDDKNYIFTHVNYYHYSPPPGFCFDLLCKDQPIRDDPNLQSYNLVEKSNALASYFKSQALHFRTSTLMHTLGEDFHFANARMWYKNFDKLIKFINSRPQLGVKLKYSTPTDYIHDLNQNSSSVKFPTKTDDFFPYADRQNAYWTGFFTSRTSVKGFVRDFGRFLQAARKHIAELKILGVSDFIKSNGQEIQKSIWGMQMAMGILQHHDAVAGTEKQRVAEDYLATGLRSIDNFNKIYRQIKRQEINKQIGQSISAEDINFNIFWNNTAKMTGIDSLVTANKNILFNLHNPGAKDTYQIKIRVPEHQFNIVTPTSSSIQGDVICPNLADTTDCELIFDLQMEANSNNYVKIVPVKSGSAKIVKLKSLSAITPKATIQVSSTVQINLNKALNKIDLEIPGSNQTFSLGYNYYDSYQGEGQKSGAYIFRPANNTPKVFSSTKNYHYAEGTKVAVVILEGQRTQTKLYFIKRPSYVENYGFQMQSFIGSIPINDKQGKEVILTYTGNYNNAGIFYTDSNGLEQQQRKLNYRPTWPLVVNEPVSGNYYPINSHISIVDNNTSPSSPKRLTIITDRSQGGSVINNGNIEIMVNRRTTFDDARGVGEPLDQVQPNKEGLTQSIRHWVVFGQKYREVQKRNDEKVMISFMPSSSATFSKKDIKVGPIQVPKNVKLFLRAFTDGTYLIRLHNMDSNAQSTVNLDGWDLTEYTLAANQLKSDWDKSQFKWSEQVQLTDDKFEQNPLSVLQKVKKLFMPLFSEKNTKKDNIAESQANNVVLQKFQIRTYKMVKSQ